MRFTEERGQAMRELLNDYSLVKGRLYIRIRNRERHADELEELACREFLEFAITCHIDVSDFIHGASVAVTKKMADSYGITEAQLFEDALENAQKIRPAKVEEVDKMKPLELQPQGSRVASIHNGSSLFTGDAGSGESNIRRYVVENDLVDAIIQLPNNIFYNTGITTYVWILTNKKEARRKGKVQLIDATSFKAPLRKNLGEKNCESRL